MILERARTQRVYITLLGPRNETLTGQLNMTDFQSLGRTGHQNALAAKDDDIKHYDSRGAAYYICVFILVYALAIVMFVASLAKRRRFEQNGDFSRLPKSDILHYYSSEGGGGTGAAPLRGEAIGAAAAEQKRCSKDASESGTHLGGGSGGQDIWSAAGRKDGPPQVGSRRRGDAAASTPDELITLVQVLPCGEGSGGGGGVDGDEPRLDNYYWTEGRDSDASASAAAYPPEPDQKCRWSIGPDGNLFILQVDESDSCTNFRLDDENCDLQTRIADRKAPPPDRQKHHEVHRRHTNGQHSGVTSAAAASDATKARSISHDNLTSSCDQRIVASSRSPPVEKCSGPRGGAVSAMAKCNSASFFQQQDTVVLATADNNNYNCDFGNPWAQPNYYPEIQKLLHVTSV